MQYTEQILMDLGVIRLEQKFKQREFKIGLISRNLPL